MRRAILISLISLSTAAQAFAADWVEAIKPLKSSIFQLTGPLGYCTAFMINQEKHLVLTAAHCWQEEMFVDRRPAKVKAIDPQRDLLVLEVEDLDQPALPLAKDAPEVGAEIVAVGYGYGLEVPFFRFTHVSADELNGEDIGIRGQILPTDLPFISGMSGGPVLNAAGEVVSVVQKGDYLAGFGAARETIKDSVGRYFQIQ